jgi:hypothetical protein
MSKNIVFLLKTGLDSIIKRIESEYPVRLSFEVEKQGFHFEYKFFLKKLGEYENKCIHIEVLEKDTLTSANNEELVIEWLKTLSDELNFKIRDL